MGFHSGFLLFCLNRTLTKIKYYTSGPGGGRAPPWLELGFKVAIFLPIYSSAEAVGKGSRLIFGPGRPCRKLTMTRLRPLMLPTVARVLSGWYCQVVAVAACCWPTCQRQPGAAACRRPHGPVPAGAPIIRVGRVGLKADRQTQRPKRALAESRPSATCTLHVH